MPAGLPSMHIIHRFMHLHSPPVRGIAWYAGRQVRRTDLRGSVNGKVDFMRAFYGKRLYLVLGALAAALLTWGLLAAGILLVPQGSGVARLFFTAGAAFSLSGGLLLVWSVLRSSRTPALTYAWLRWGRWAGAGALGGILTAMGAFLAASRVLVHLGATAWVFFLVLELGGLLGLAGTYAAVRFRCCCKDTCG